MKNTISLLLVLALGLASVCLAAEDTWAKKADMPTARSYLSASVLDGKIYAIGGLSDQTISIPTLEVYDPVSDTWARKTDMPTARLGLSTSVVRGRIYAIGGLPGAGVVGAACSKVEEYDPVTDTWVEKADMPTARLTLASEVVDGKIYTIGGHSTEPGGGLIFSTVEVYDPVTDTWTRKANMPTTRTGLSAGVVDGKIYAIGGTAGSPWNGLHTVEAYDPVTDTWIRKADMPTGRYNFSISVVNGKIYAIGGVPGLSSGLRTVEVYDPATDTWTQGADMPTGKLASATGTVDGKIYVIGGCMFLRPFLPVFRTMEEYDTGFGVPPPELNIGPVADAGLLRYAAQDPVVLDGTGSYDLDNSGPLSYAWQQIDGPPVIIIDANTATPIIAGSMVPTSNRDPTPIPGGFPQTDEIQECEFELIVSDGELTSLPDTVKVIIVPDFGENTLRLANDSFDPSKPTFVWFQGGNCIIGQPYQVTWDSDWLSLTNIIDFPGGYVPDTDGNPRTYYDYADMIIVYLSSVAPDYKMPIQTCGISTGGQPAIDVGIHLNLTYRDARYAVNHVTFQDATGYCRDYSESVSIFLNSTVDGEQCWIDNYVGTLAGADPSLQYPSFHPDVLNILFDKATDSSLSWIYRHQLPAFWYGNSLTRGDMNRFNYGVVAGAYWSVAGLGKNLQLASTPGVETYKFTWYGDASSGYMDFYDEPNHPGRLPEPVTLVGPEDSAFVDTNGALLSCEESENAVGYQLLFGSEPFRVMDYMIVSDTPEPPSEVITTFPFEQTFWTVRVYDEYGSTIYADPICIFPENVEDSSETFVPEDEL